MTKYPAYICNNCTFGSKIIIAVNVENGVRILKSLPIYVATVVLEIK